MGENSDAATEGDRAIALTSTSMKHLHHNVCINAVSDHTNTLSTLHYCVSSILLVCIMIIAQGGKVVNKL